MCEVWRGVGVTFRRRDGDGYGDGIRNGDVEFLTIKAANIRRSWNEQYANLVSNDGPV